MCLNKILKLMNDALVPKPTHVPELETHLDRQGYRPAAAVCEGRFGSTSSLVAKRFRGCEFSKLEDAPRLPKEISSNSSFGLKLG